MAVAGQQCVSNSTEGVFNANHTSAFAFGKHGKISLAFATAVYGEHVHNACRAAVLGQALRVLDPTVPRVAVVDWSLSEGATLLLTRHRVWSLKSLQQYDNVLNIRLRLKVALWLLVAYDRVLFFDSDHLPVLSGSAAQLRARAAAFRRLYRTGGELVAMRDLGERSTKLGEHCFNSGLMLLQPGQAQAARIALLSRLWMKDPHHPKFQRCATATHPWIHPMSDQIPLNAAFPEWEPSPLHTANPFEGLAPGANHTPASSGAFADLHTYHTHLEDRTRSAWVKGAAPTLCRKGAAAAYAPHRRSTQLRCATRATRLHSRANGGSFSRACLRPL